MPTIDIPGMKRRLVSAPHVGDIEFFADFGSDALDKESVPIIGAWSDELLQETSSGGPPSRTQLMFGGIANRLQGTEADFEGERLPDLNEVGQNIGTIRRRKRIMCRPVV